MLSAAKRPFTSVLVWYKEVHTSDIFRHTVHFLVFLGAVQSIQIISVSPGQQWPGFSFVLHLLSVQGFYFCPAAIQPHTSLYGGFSAVHAIYTTTTPKAFTGLYSGVPVDLTYSNERNTAATQAAYYNKVYKGAAVRPLLWIHARRYNIAQTMPAAARPVHPACIRCRG